MDLTPAIHPNRRERWRLLASKIRSDPSLLHRSLANLDRWEQSDRLGNPAMLARWRNLVESALASTPGLDALIELILAEDDDALTLKSCSPLVGILTRAERRALPCTWMH